MSYMKGIDNSKLALDMLTHAYKGDKRKAGEQYHHYMKKDHNMTINDMFHDVHKNRVAHGSYEKPKPVSSNPQQVSAIASYLPSSHSINRKAGDLAGYTVGALKNLGKWFSGKGFEGVPPGGNGRGMKGKGAAKKKKKGGSIGPAGYRIGKGASDIRAIGSVDSNRGQKGPRPVVGPDEQIQEGRYRTMDVRPGDRYENGWFIRRKPGR